jgi:hypothetical protein
MRKRLGIETLERKFLEKYGSMTEYEYWWFVDQALRELTEGD